MLLAPASTTLGCMRANGVRTLAAWCLGRGCNHFRVLDVSGYPDDIRRGVEKGGHQRRLPDLGQQDGGEVSSVNVVGTHQRETFGRSRGKGSRGPLSVPATQPPGLHQTFETRIGTIGFRSVSPVRAAFAAIGK